jgi:hypothetical protein
MTIADQRKRLAKLEARKRKVRIREDHATDVEISRAIGFALYCGVEGIGGPPMLEAATQIAHLLAKAPQFSPEERAAAAEKAKRAHLRHGV